VLEIGCGTGLDSEFLVSRGIDVIATEPSSEMIARARTRLGSRATAIQCALEGVDDALRTHDAAPALFDGIFSDFGALNCVADLGPLARLADRRLAHGGRIVLCFMTGYCLWEMAQVIGGKNATATRRFAPRGAPVMVRVGDVEVATFYHRPRDVMNALGASYRLLRTRGLAVVVPPPYMESVWHRMPRAARRALTVIDDTIAPHWPFNRCGDHIVLDIVKG
jgi:SAM-dependent methyltransferase